MLQYISWATIHPPLKSVGGKDLQRLLLGAKQLAGRGPHAHRKYLASVSHTSS